MKDQETVQKFIELRSKGISFARIAEQLGVAKSTLVLLEDKTRPAIQDWHA
jgi:orotate phosphoribosyltransferase-like protein